MLKQERTVTPILQAPQLLLAACQGSEFSASLSILLGHRNVGVFIGSFSRNAVAPGPKLSSFYQPVKIHKILIIELCFWLRYNFQNLIFSPT